MAQVPERCMQMLKQIITEIENRQNITRDQLALLLETTDTGDIAFLHERARKTAVAIFFLHSGEYPLKKKKKKLLKE